MAKKDLGRGLQCGLYLEVTENHIPPRQGSEGVGFYARPLQGVLGSGRWPWGSDLTSQILSFPRGR